MEHEDISGFFTLFFFSLGSGSFRPPVFVSLLSSCPLVLTCPLVQSVSLSLQVTVGSNVCFFCEQKVYVMERLSAEGLFFHRSCFRCDSCSAPLRLVSYSYDQDAGQFTDDL